MLQTLDTIGTVLDIKSITFTFDQSGRISFSYATSVSSFLYWFDSSLGMTVTTDLGADALGPTLLLDDKRTMQSTVSDMLLWYTKADGGGTFTLYMLRQRDRFLNEIQMDTLLPNAYLRNIGMTDELRLQMTLGKS